MGARSNILNGGHIWLVPEEESGIVADKRDARFNEKQEEETGEDTRPGKSSN